MYTDLENNDKLTYDMTTYEVMKYLLDYIAVLFQKEQQYIRNALHNLTIYQEAFGSEFLNSLLLEGVVKNIHSYYPNREAEFVKLISNAKHIIQCMKEYSDVIEQRYHVKFTISKYLEEVK